jgi:hypothetical protein
LTIAPADGACAEAWHNPIQNVRSSWSGAPIT